MKLLLITDAWYPQTNGVVRTLDTIIGHLREMNYEVTVVSPDQFRSIPCPTYPEIRLAWGAKRRIHDIILKTRPDFIHVATEGPLGYAARRVCLKYRFPFTTAYHTKFPEYIQARLHIPLAIAYRLMRWFHRPSAGVMVATASLRRELEGRGFANIRGWSRGVDLELFRPHAKAFLSLPRPIFLYVGRVAVEKNIRAFLEQNIPRGTKLVVGDGPLLSNLRQEFPDVHFAGMKHGEELARYYAASDVFVFPSLTDTFGLVLLEALASGVPVAAYPVTGPIDVIGDHPRVGVLDNDLGRAMQAALDLDPADCRAFAEQCSWEACARQFALNLQGIAKNQAPATDAQAGADGMLPGPIL